MKLNLRQSLLSGDYDGVPAAIAGFILVQMLCAYGGIGISPDSVVYISTAQNIHDHGAINDFTNMPVMDFPALYPIFLSVFLFLTGNKPPAFGPILDGLLFATLIGCCAYIMNRFTRVTRTYKAILLVFIVLSPCLLEVYSMIWSETLFLLLSVVFLIAAHGYFQTHSLRRLAGMALVAGLAGVTRYAGVSLIALGGLLLLCDGGIPWSRRKFGHWGLYALVAILPLGLNLLRNQLLTQTLTGYREPGETPFVNNLHTFGAVLCDWLPFFNERYGAATGVAVLFILGITGRFIDRLVRRKDFFSYSNLALSYFVVYGGFILFTATVSRFQPLDSRLLSPLFLPWLWGSSSWIPPALQRCARPWKGLAVVASLAAAACFLIGEVHDFRENWDGIHYAGIPGYTETSWKESETMAYVRQHKDSLLKAGPVYSDAFEGLWFLADVQADLIPHKDNPEDIRYMMKQDHFTIVWFDDAVNFDLIDVDFMRTRKELVEERHFKDGSVYFFKTPADSTAMPPH
jgi:hypothetical protein